ncbi:MAG: branched-chain amino acid ABC transporter permease [Alphaproteobacteria bacterium]|nr:branched-chain amino acid ABC transporter permease [Alphaproteobacteria bacterium]
MIVELLQQVFNGLVMGSVYVLVALGLTVIFGILGVAHFAHGSVAMFGGYFTFFLGQKLGLSLFPAMLLAMPAGALLGVVIERLAYRPVRDAPHINAFIIALGLSLLIDKVNLLAFGADQIVIASPYRKVYDVGGVAMTELRLYVLGTSLALVSAMGLLIHKTKTGRAVRAVAQNRPAAILMGVNVERVSMIVFGISSALGIAAGALIGALFAVAPGVAEGLTIKGFAILILGGLGSFPGAIIGGLVLGVSESLAAGLISSAYKDVIAFLVMIVVLLFRPEGLMGKRT